MPMQSQIQLQRSPLQQRRQRQHQHRQPPPQPVLGQPPQQQQQQPLVLVPLVVSHPHQLPWQQMQRHVMVWMLCLVTTTGFGCVCSHKTKFQFSLPLFFYSANCWFRRLHAACWHCSGSCVDNERSTKRKECFAYTKNSETAKRCRIWVSKSQSISIPSQYRSQMNSLS